MAERRRRHVDPNDTETREENTPPTYQSPSRRWTDAFVRAVPGLRVGTPKRNTIGLLVYLLGTLLAVSVAWLLLAV